MERAVSALAGAPQQVERILSSVALSKVEGSRRLLAYLAEQSFIGRADNLKEYTIGLEAFGKAPEYDTQEDPSVRICAAKLRQKLDEYYRQEGIDDGILVTLPKGCFRLTFEPRPLAAPVPTEPVPAPPAESRPVNNRLWPVTAAILAVALLITAAWGWRSSRRLASLRDPWTPALETIWAPFLDSTRPILLSMGTPLFLRTPWGYVRHYSLRYEEEAVRIHTLIPDLPAKDFGQMQPSYVWTGYGDAIGGIRVTSLLSSRSHELRGVTGGLLTWENITNCNLVFLGSQVSNSQIRDLPLAQEFLLENQVLRNLKPKSGEPKELKLNTSETGVIDEYALVTKLTGLQGKGEIMILAGMTNAGTMASAEWVTEPASADLLVRRLRQPDGALPRQYHIVLHVRSKDGVPIVIEYMFDHVLPAAPASFR